MLKSELKEFLNLIYSYLYYQKDQWLEVNNVNRQHYENFKYGNDKNAKAILLPDTADVYASVVEKTAWVGTADTAQKVLFWKTGARAFRMGRDPVLTSEVILKTVPKELINSVYRPKWTVTLTRYPYRMQILLNNPSDSIKIGVTQQSAGFNLTHFVQNRDAAKVNVSTQQPDWSKSDADNLLEVIQYREVWMQPVAGWQFTQSTGGGLAAPVLVNRWSQLFDIYMLTVMDNRASFRRGFKKESLTDNSDNFSKGYSHTFRTALNGATGSMPSIKFPVHLGNTFVFSDRIYAAEWADKFGMNYDQPYFVLTDSSDSSSPLWERGYKTYNQSSPSKYNYSDLIPFHAYSASLCTYPFENIQA